MMHRKWISGNTSRYALFTPTFH